MALELRYTYTYMMPKVTRKMPAATAYEALERLSLILAQLDLHVSQLAPQGVGMGALPASHEVLSPAARLA